MHFAIRSRGDGRFVIWLANCDQTHADSVLKTVSAPNFQGPRDLYMEPVERLYDAPKPRWKLWGK